MSHVQAQFATVALCVIAVCQFVRTLPARR